jgi:hypothetical protein
MELIPTHVRDLYPLLLRKVHDTPPESTETMDTWRLLARFEEQLVSETNPKIGTIGGNPCLDHFPKSSLAELAGTITERTDPGHDQSRAFCRVRLIQNMNARGACMLDGTLYAAEVSASVIDEAQ